jgi:DNA-nicking Smr family endonuclease
MDFGDILDKWEKQKTGSGVIGTDPVNEKKTNPIDSWLRVNGIYDKDAECEGAQHSAQDTRRRLKNKKPEAELDIHGLTHDEAWQALEVFFADANRKGLEKILIIHGKGNHSTGDSAAMPVLKRTVMTFIEHCPFAGESGKEKTSAGGEGATWVLLKKVKP